jgi:hypothetical protein
MIITEINHVVFFVDVRIPDECLNTHMKCDTLCVATDTRATIGIGGIIINIIDVDRVVKYPVTVARKFSADTATAATRYIRTP